MLQDQAIAQGKAAFMVAEMLMFSLVERGQIDRETLVNELDHLIASLKDTPDPDHHLVAAVSDLCRSVAIACEKEK